LHKIDNLLIGLITLENGDNYTKILSICPGLTKSYFLLILVYTNIGYMVDLSTIDPQNPPKEIVRVSVSEAARLFGVNPQTIRRAIKDNDITYVVVAGRYKINFESLVRWSQKKTTVRNKSNSRGIGQFVDKWSINNTLYSPSKKSVKKPDSQN